MTPGNAAAAQNRVIVWCLDCRHQIEPEPASIRPQLQRQSGDDFTARNVKHGAAEDCPSIRHTLERLFHCKTTR
jgi:hypothetical protein